MFLAKWYETEDIKELVENYYDRYGLYPQEVRTENNLYTYDEYWSILDKEYLNG